MGRRRAKEECVQIDSGVGRILGSWKGAEGGNAAWEHLGSMVGDKEHLQDCFKRGFEVSSLFEAA